MRRAWLVLVAACSGGRAAAPPGATGTMVVDRAATEARMRSIAAALTDREFLRGFVEASHLGRQLGDDPVATLASAVHAAPRRDSRILEVSVALPDLALARSVCNQLIEAYLEVSGDTEVAPLDECRATP